MTKEKLTNQDAGNFSVMPVMKINIKLKYFEEFYSLTQESICE